MYAEEEEKETEFNWGSAALYPTSSYTFPARRRMRNLKTDNTRLASVVAHVMIGGIIIREQKQRTVGHLRAEQGGPLRDLAVFSVLVGRGRS